MKRVFLFLGLVILALWGTGCASVSPPREGRSVERRILTTGYCPCGECCGWRRNWLLTPVYTSGPLKGKRKEVGVTASGVKAHRGTIAADTGHYPFGTVMYVEGYGAGRVEDQGGAIIGEHIDLFFPTHREAMAWGKRVKWVRVWFNG